MPAGRPSIPYDPVVADAICELLATSDLGLSGAIDVLRADGYTVPSVAVVYKWLADSVEFQEKSARARELQGDTLADMAMQESVRSRIGEITSEKQVIVNGETRTIIERKIADNVERSKLIVQTIFKRAGQLNSKKYGERLQVDASHAFELVLPASVAERFAGALTGMSNGKLIEGNQDSKQGEHDE